ncbi:MAG: BlaI/MecI/CopY family transcriptional regulator [Bacteroidales bacterium]|jgi:predicted transcriptional regulator|nr:BlaI/MecI/CopY family transcriptional regulator [Bacteroidales bacterium]MBQ1708737.1 BlaI/MecI/CopY family transcriptional regulator [Bacteroidales bacterium]
MEKLTAKEEEVLRLIWAHGPVFIQDLLKYYPDPKPHYNTVATQVGFLEEKGYVAREKFANAYRYHALVDERGFADLVISDTVQKFYDNSYASVVSRFVEEEKMDLDELKALIAQIENGQK